MLDSGTTIGIRITSQMNFVSIYILLTYLLITCLWRIVLSLHIDEKIFF